MAGVGNSSAEKPLLSLPRSDVTLSSEFEAKAKQQDEKQSTKMQMKDSLYQHVCTVLIGVATLFRFISYDMGSFIVTSLVYSAHQRDPSSIINNAGYYGQAVKEVASCISTFFIPIVLNYIKPKWALVIACALSAFYMASLFYINNLLYFTANVMLGISFTMGFIAYSTYQMQFSTRKTLARNATIAWGIISISLLGSGAMYIYVTNTHATPADEMAKIGNEQFRYYSENETKILTGLLFATSVISLVIHAFLPSREVANSVTSENPHVKLTLLQQVGAIASVMVNPYILMFIPRFLNHGVYFSFLMNIYPTSLQFSSILATNYPMLTAYYAFALCAGGTLSGIVTPPLNKMIHDFGLRPLYYITCALQLTTYAIAALTIPNLSTAVPTDESAIIEPHVFWVCLTAFIMGLADSTNTASNTVICSRLIPGRASHTYSAARFYVGIAAAIIFFCSPLLTMRMHAIILVSTTVISGLTFDFAVRQVEKREELAKKTEIKEAIEEKI